MRKLLLLLLLLPLPAFGQGTQIVSGPNNPPNCNPGMMFFNTTSQQMQICASANTWSTTAGAGTVTHTSGSLTSGKIVIGNGSADIKADAVASTDGIGNITASSINASNVVGDLITPNDGVHSGIIGLNGNSAVPLVPANTAGFIGPSLSGFSAYGLQLPYLGPQATATNILNCGLPSYPGGVSTCSFGGSAAVGTGSVTIGSGSSIGATSLCSTANCPLGTYDVGVYVDITTACTTTGTYIVWLGWTDDKGAKTGSSTTTFIPVNGLGVTQSTGALALASTNNYAQGHHIIHTTGAATGGLGAINYGTTATTCGTGGPMVGTMYLTVERLQ
jgi:hypothetical protein